MLNYAAFVAGLAIVVVTVYDVFLGVVVPRPAGHKLRLAPRVSAVLWPRWKAASARLRGRKRTEFLSSFAPFMLFALLALWVTLLIFGYALMLWALRAQVQGDSSFKDSIFLAGVAFLTIGMGDVVPSGLGARAVVLIAGATGIVLTALVISLSFTLYGAFSKRESLVLTLDARAGSPPSGVALLETFAQFDLLEDLPTLFDRWETWAAEILESHLAYPLLPFFRSSHRGASWAAALGAVMDAATLLIATVQPNERCGQRPIGAAHLMFHMGCRVLNDFHVKFFQRDHAEDADESAQAQDQEESESPPAPGIPGISRADFMEARHRLEQCGFELRPEEESWRSLAQHRAVYWEQIDELAKYYAIPGTRWGGQRSTLSFASEHSAHPKAHSEGEQVLAAPGEPDQAADN
jgi:hypothetical protein